MPGQIAEILFSKVAKWIQARLKSFRRWGLGQGKGFRRSQRAMDFEKFKAEVAQRTRKALQAQGGGNGNGGAFVDLSAIQGAGDESRSSSVRGSNASALSLDLSHASRSGKKSRPKSSRLMVSSAPCLPLLAPHQPF